MSKTKLYLIGAAVIVLLLIGIFVGWKFAGGLLVAGGVEELYRNQKKTIDESQKEMKEQAEEVEKDSEKRAEKAKKVVKESDKRDKRAEKLNKDDKHRKEKADDLEKEGKKREKEAEDLDEELENNDDNLKNMFNVLLILLVSLSILFSGPVLAQNSPEQFNPDNFKKAESLEEANQMLDNLLEITLNYRNLAYDYREKYNQEKQDKKEFKNLYEEERQDKLAFQNMYNEEKEDKTFFKDLYNEEKQDNKELQNIVENQRTLIEMSQNMNEFLSKQSKGGFGLYGGVNYKPLKPLESGVEAGVSFDF